MGRIEQIIEEISEYRNSVNHRAALRIYNLLENNKKLFLEYFEPDVFKLLTKNFEELSHANLSDQKSSAFERDYSRSFESLYFHLQKII
jgi:hypothetical protein